MSDQDPQDSELGQALPARPPSEKRHKVSNWFLLLGALAFLLGCYLLFIEDGTQVRTLVPPVSPRSELPTKDVEGSGRADVTTTGSVTVVSPTMGSARRFPPDFTESLWRDAAAVGVRRVTFDRALPATLSPDPDVISLSLNQPEFDRTVGDYVTMIVNADRIAVGRARLEQQSGILDAIERRYGVDRSILLAIWGIETDFGLAKGDRGVFRSLATLASADSKRAAQWRAELTAALGILERDKLAPERLMGSWAGAMGHTQFMPSTYLKYGTDFDGDGVCDVWNSVPDALASTARYLQASGWIAGRAWGREVVLPTGFDLALASPSSGRSITSWRVLGVRAAVGVLPGDDGANWQIVLPAGAGGPAFLVSANFDSLLNYNRAYAYAIAVGALADRLAGLGGIRAPWPVGDRPMTREQRIELQEILVSLGFDTGGVDGLLGVKSRDAIRAFQKAKGLPADGYPSVQLLSQMRTERRL